MLFDSAVYFVFLSIVVVVYWRLRFRAQNAFLLAASYFFYAWWDWRFAGLMAISTLLDFSIARAIGRAGSERKRRTLLVVSLAINFGLLGFFKYFDFFVASAVQSLEALGFHSATLAPLHILLPAGISFYTFQEVAYIVDVYNRRIEPADSVLDYALFISLFPHLIAGPIQRPSHLLPQVQQPRRWDADKAFDGALLILEGLFRKCVVADQCALVANAVFSGRMGAPNGALVLIGSYAFAWQIYGDFSGYSSIARGSAQLLGFHFMVNFRQPYLATSLQDFWRRWHISLSTWLRDYLYIPLGGSRGGRWKTYRNLLLTMLLGGLWHGANWTFVVWGGIHGSWLAVERALEIGGDRAMTFAGRWVRRIFIFHLVCIAWVFFRAASIPQAISFLKSLAVWSWQGEYGVAARLVAVVVVPLLLIDLQLESSGNEYLFASTSWRPRVAVGLAFTILVAFFSANEPNAFIYFQF